jgi:hypothetical protein
MANDLSLDKVLLEIKKTYGIPSRIIVGGDVNSESILNGRTGAFYFRQLFGDGVVISYPHGAYVSKRVQLQAASSRILNNFGQRRFAVAEKLRSHYPNKRGIKEMLSRISYLKTPGRSKEFYEKNKDKNTYVDCFDAFLYLCVCLYPPQASLSNTWAE